MDREQIIKEIKLRAEAARQAYEEAEKHAGPCEIYLMKGQWIAMQNLLEDIHDKRI